MKNIIIELDDETGEYLKRTADKVGMKLDSDMVDIDNILDLIYELDESYDCLKDEYQELEEDYDRYREENKPQNMW